MQLIPPVKAYFPEEDRKWITKQIDEMLVTGQLTLGKMGQAFEEEFAKLAGVQYAVAVGSGTEAIEIPLRILDVARKDVLVPTNTFFATAAAVIHAGGRPVFVDSDPSDFALSIKSLEKQITPDTVGVILVHIAGIVSQRTEAIVDWCKQKGFWLFEDAAHAHGSTLNGKHAGAFGIAGSFSFYPTKVMTSAEGGMIITNDKRIAEEAKLYRDQGKTSFLENTHGKLGYNWRLSEPHAAIGLAQARRLKEINVKRVAIAKFYDEALSTGFAGRPLALAKGQFSNYYKYVFLPDKILDRKTLKKKLKENYGVCLGGEVYETPLHQQPVFKSMAKGRFPVAEEICARHICLPLFPSMTTDEARHVVESLKEALNG